MGETFSEYRAQLARFRAGQIEGQELLAWTEEYQPDQSENLRLILRLTGCRPASD